MLRALGIRDFVIVERVELETGAGFTVLTGQTGAGKSILVDAIELLVGGRGDARAHFDGFALTDLQEGDRLMLKRSADSIRFVHPPGYSYFTMLREKLRWSNAVGARTDD